MDKQNFFDTIFPHPLLESLMSHLDKNQFLEARNVLFDIIEDTKPEYEYIKDDGEMIIYNGKIKQLKRLDALYVELMSEIEKEITEDAKVRAY